MARRARRASPGSRAASPTAGCRGSPVGPGDRCRGRCWCWCGCRCRCCQKFPGVEMSHLSLLPGDLLLQRPLLLLRQVLDLALQLLQAPRRGELGALALLPRQGGQALALPPRHGQRVRFHPRPLRQGGRGRQARLRGSLQLGLATGLRLDMVDVELLGGELLIAVLAVHLGHGGGLEHLLPGSARSGG